MYEDMTWNQLRKLATDNGIKVHGRGRGEIEAELSAGEIAVAPPKGRKSWAPARMLDLAGKLPGFRYRWVDHDPANIRKKIAEGWTFVNRETGHPVTHDDPNLVHGGANGTLGYRDLVAMAMPEETAAERDAYFREKAEEQLAGVNEKAASNMQNIGPMATTRKGNLEITRIK